MKVLLRWTLIVVLLSFAAFKIVAPVYAVPFLEAVAWSPDGTKIAVTYGINCMPDSNYIAILDAITGDEISRHYSEDCYYTGLDWSPDGAKLAAARARDAIRIFDVNTWSLLLTMEAFPRTDDNGRFGLRWSPDGTLLANLVVDSSSIEIWNASTGARTFGYPGHSGLATGFAWSPNSQYIASTGDDDTVQVWDVHTFETILVLHGHTDDSTSVDWSPDGQRLASLGLDRTIRVWDANTGASLNVITGLVDTPVSAEWRPFSEQIGFAVWNNTVQVWDVVTGTLVETIDINGVPYGLRWSPNGMQLAYVVVPPQLTSDLPFAVSTVATLGLTPAPPTPTPET